jgi:acetyl-CoA carboxylase biotin carboxyl carrier protein
MTDSDQALEAIRAAAERLVPELTERLRRHGLGEIEVAHGDLRLRVAAAPGSTPAAVPSASVAGDVSTDAPQPAVTESAVTESVASTVGVASPAVGFFVYADGLGPGLAVAKGDELGHVEMLGIRHDVRAPRGGTVRNLVAESGEAVEYGQVVLELEAAEAGR